MFVRQRQRGPNSAADVVGAVVAAALVAVPAAAATAPAFAASAHSPFGGGGDGE